MTTMASLTKLIGIRFSGGGGGPSARFGTLALGSGRLGNDTDDDSDYTNLQEYVLSATIRRGRVRELEEYSSGTCTVVLDNQDGRFDPNNSSSPYAGNIKPGKLLRIKITDPTTGVVEPLFQGNITQWDITYSFPNFSRCTIRASDALHPISKNTVSLTTSAAETGTVIREILQDADWTSYDLDVGDSTLQAKTFTNANALQSLQLATQSEGITARLYASKDNKVVFKNRQAIYNDTNSSTSQATFGSGGNLSFEKIDIDFDDELVRNKVSISKVSGTAQVVSDSDSIVAYNEKSYVKSDLLINSNAESLNYAQAVLSEFKEPAVRCKSMKFSPLKHTDLITQSLSRDISDRITVDFNPPGSGTTFSKQLIIGGITHTIKPEQWETTFMFSSSNTDSLTWFQLGAISGTNDQLDTGTFGY
jgi:hypothetical protein|tara:strand:- start:300 stop:1559 length:1260 start_codon:yes stop_codon:yes gene_type:complete